MKTKADIGTIQPESKEHQEISVTGKAREDSLPEP